MASGDMLSGPHIFQDFTFRVLVGLGSVVMVQVRLRGCVMYV